MKSVACAGFILAGAEKKSGGAESHPKGAKKFSAPTVFVFAPPAEFDSAPGAEHTRGGAYAHCAPRLRTPLNEVHT